MTLSIFGGISYRWKEPRLAFKGKQYVSDFAKQVGIDATSGIDGVWIPPLIVKE